MIRSHCSKEDRGIAALEMAGVMIVVLSILLGGVALTDFLRQVGYADKLTDRYIFDDAIRPMTFSTAGGTFQISVDTARLSSYVDDVVQKSEDELTALFPDLSSSEYFIEVRSAEIQIDGVSGAPIAVELNGTNALTQLVGGLSLSSELNQITDLNAQFAVLGSTVDGAGVSLFASPLATYGVSGATDRYLSSVIVIGMRVIWSLENGFTGNVLKQVGSDPFVYDSKVSVLRGDIEA